MVLILQFAISGTDPIYPGMHEKAQDPATWLARLASDDIDIDLIRCLWITSAQQWRIDQRRHDDHILYIISKGSVRWWIDGCEQVWTAGTCAWIGPGIRHAARPVVGPAALRFGVLRCGLRQRDGTPLAAPGPPLILGHGQELRSDLDAVIDAAQLPGCHQGIRVRATLVQLFARICELAQDTAGGHGLDATQLRLLHQVLDRTWQHQPQPDDLAQALGCSLSTLRRAMRHTWNLSPRSWILRERMRRIADLLLEDEAPLDDLAQRCGYASLPSFMRLFTQVMGIAPGRWRSRGHRTP